MALRHLSDISRAIGVHVQGASGSNRGVCIVEDLASVHTAARYTRTQGSNVISG